MTILHTCTATDTRLVAVACEDCRPPCGLHTSLKPNLQLLSGPASSTSLPPSIVMKTGSDSETTRGQCLRVHRRGPWWSLALVAAVALIFYQFPLIKVTILQHCSRNANQSDANNQQWENFDWDAVSELSVPFGVCSRTFVSRT